LPTDNQCQEMQRGNICSWQQKANSNYNDYNHLTTWSIIYIFFTVVIGFIWEWCICCLLTI